MNTCSRSLSASGSMYAPSVVESGSSVSHWDVTVTPNALMEPMITGTLHDTIDLTKAQLVDIGWFPGSVATSLQDFVAEGDADGIRLRWSFADPSDVSAVYLERAAQEAGPWSMAPPE